MNDEANKTLRLGVSLYFKQLKSLIVLYGIFTIISIPAFILYYYGGDGNNTIKNSKSFMTTFTLGNVGQSVNECIYGGDYAEISESNVVEFEIFCSFGTIMQYDFLVAADMSKNYCNKLNTVDGMRDYD